jgi:hypothetical protein
MTSPAFGFFLCHVEIMARGTNEDDEPTRWTSIGWQAALITNRLRNHAQLTKIDEQKSESDNERSSSSDEEKRALDRLKFVNLRLRELDRFENRARGQWRK